MFNSNSFTPENSVDHRSFASHLNSLSVTNSKDDRTLQTALHQDQGGWDQLDALPVKVNRSNFTTEDSMRLIKSMKTPANSGPRQTTQSFKVDRDAVTGLTSNRPTVSTRSAAKIAGNSFSSTYGYGLVNAAKAVAWSMGYYPQSLPEVQNWGGWHWGNDRVKAQAAWNWGVTGEGVTVAVIDSGVDITHPDLSNNIWQNSREIAGDGLDNDGNGYTDDLFGWNFASNQNNNNVMPRFGNLNEAHGTHVAGTIAASWNGLDTTTGIAPHAQIMALRIGDVNPDHTFSNSGNLAKAIYYAVNNGAKVINMSLGWSGSIGLERALSYAASRNVMVVSAAGNDSRLQPGTPASYATRYGISVGAVDSQNRIANFSNRAGFNSQLAHVVAPGQDIVSTMPTNDYDGRSYDRMSGTSMAAPHVAGVVALMLSANPDLTHAQVRYILAASASSYGVSSIGRNHSQKHRASLHQVSDQWIGASTQLTSAQLISTQLTPVQLTSTQLPTVPQLTSESQSADTQIESLTLRASDQDTKPLTELGSDWAHHSIKFRQTALASIELDSDQLMAIKLYRKA